MIINNKLCNNKYLGNIVFVFCFLLGICLPTHLIVITQIQYFTKNSRYKVLTGIVFNNMFTFSMIYSCFWCIY